MRGDRWRQNRARGKGAAVRPGCRWRGCWAASSTLPPVGAASREASLLADWATIVGPALARRCQPVRVDYAPGRRSGGTLLLQVGGAAALEIQHAAPQLLERINAYFGHKAVRQLRLMQMPLPPHSRRRNRRGCGAWRRGKRPPSSPGSPRSRTTPCGRPCWRSAGP